MLRCASPYSNVYDFFVFITKIGHFVQCLKESDQNFQNCPFLLDSISSSDGIGFWKEKVKNVINLNS